MRKKYLIIGGDSKLGKHLCSYLKEKKFFFFKTSRKNKKNFLLLDLKKPNKFVIPKDINYCFFLAGITSYEKCEKNKSSKIINVKNTFYLIKNLIMKGIHVNFISSNTVFGGMTLKTNEHDKKNPKFAYAKHKSQCEDKIIKWTKKNKLQKFLSITRLTKMIDSKSMPLPFWQKKIKKKEKIFPFNDYYFSPITFSYVCRSLIKISKHNFFGIFHLSNNRNLSYCSFSKIYLKKNKNLIECISMNTKKNIIFRYKPIYADIKMKYTKKNLNIVPQNMKSLLRNLL